MSASHLYSEHILILLSAKYNVKYKVYKLRILAMWI
jgi:hypothetical protein